MCEASTITEMIVEGYVLYCGLLWCLYHTRLRCLAWDWSGGVEIVKAGERIRVGERNGPRGPRLCCLQEACQDLDEPCSKGIDRSLGFILFAVANAENLVEQGGAPGLARREAGKDELLEEWVEVPTGHDDIKSREEVVVCEGNDALGSSEHLAEDNALCGSELDPFRVGVEVCPEAEDAEEHDNRDTVSEFVAVRHVCVCI